jgi:hypothetical protein
MTEPAELIQKVREGITAGEKLLHAFPPKSWKKLCRQETTIQGNPAHDLREALSALDRLSALCDSPTGQGSEAEARFTFGYFPRAKYQDLVFYVKGDSGMNRQLFEMPDLPANRALMEALSCRRPAPVKEVPMEMLMEIFTTLSDDTTNEGICRKIASKFGYTVTEKGA